MGERIGGFSRPRGEEKPALLLVHGFLGTCLAHYGSLLPLIKDRFRIFPLEWPGHGNTALPDSAYYEHCQNLMADALVRIGPAHVVGLSYLGGSLALRCALANPALMRSLIVAGIALEIPRSRFVAWNNAFTQIAFSNQEVAAQFALLHGERWQLTTRAVIAAIEENYMSSVYMDQAMFAQLRVPTLLVNGGLRSDEAAAVARVSGISDYVETHVVDGVGHLVPVEAPARFLERANVFWAQCEAGQG